MLKGFAAALATTSLLAVATSPAAASPLLDEVAEFSSLIFYLNSGVPGVVIAVVDGDESTVYGFGETRKGSGIEPTGNSTMRIGSITKAFAGQVLAHAVAEGDVSFTSPAGDFIDGRLGAALQDIQPLPLIDLVTHAGGFPREVPRPDPSDPADPFSTITYDAFADWLENNPLLFSPGSATAYSNFGFDILSAALSGATGKPYDELLKDAVTDPAGMSETGFERSAANPDLAMYGHDFDGEPLPHIPTGDVITGSGGLTTTANDMVKWMQWHFADAADGAETRLLDHAVYYPRSYYDLVSGMDDSGHMDGMGLAWIAMNETDEHPFILQKSGGLQGEMSYIAMAPYEKVGVFVSINAYNFPAAAAMAKFANELVSTLSGY